MNSLIVFVKNPVEGRVKTRIAATVGHAKAVEVYKELLAHTYETVRQWLSQSSLEEKFTVNIYYGDELTLNDFWNQLPVQKYVQTGDDLGQRMRNAFAESFENGAKKVVIIGSDCLSLRKQHLQKAFEALTTREVVIGPAKDGGYYLLGMRELNEMLFIEKSWSQPLLLGETLAELSADSVFMLDTLSDIDTWDDYINATT